MVPRPLDLAAARASMFGAEGSVSDEHWPSLAASRPWPLVARAAAAAAESSAATYAFSWAGFEVGEIRGAVVEADGDLPRCWAGRTTGSSVPCSRSSRDGSAQGRREGERFMARALRRRERVARRRQHLAGRPSRRWSGHRGRGALPRTCRARAGARGAAGGARPGIAGPDGDRGRAARDRASPPAASTAGGRSASSWPAPTRSRPAPAELACTISEPAAGRRPRARWRASRPAGATGSRVRVWLRRGAAGASYWPVRLEAASRFGTVTVRLDQHGRRSPRPG